MLPRDSDMRFLSICVPVCLSVCHVSERIHVSSNSFHRLIRPSLYFRVQTPLQTCRAKYRQYRQWGIKFRHGNQRAEGHVCWCQLWPQSNEQARAPNFCNLRPPHRLGHRQQTKVDLHFPDDVVLLEDNQQRISGRLQMRWRVLGVK